MDFETAEAQHVAYDTAAVGSDVGSANSGGSLYAGGLWTVPGNDPDTYWSGGDAPSCLSGVSPVTGEPFLKNRPSPLPPYCVFRQHRRGKHFWRRGVEKHRLVQYFWLFDYLAALIV